MIYICELSELMRGVPACYGKGPQMYPLNVGGWQTCDRALDNRTKHLVVKIRTYKRVSAMDKRNGAPASTPFIWPIGTLATGLSSGLLF
jgi:hypothetical protein